ncbi:MAG: hypothetical protein K2O54_01420 [Prevotella sp.]|nr:hypothetical protein [Prevotella sp.]
MQVLKMTSESVALDELGIGRIRDAFANRMFPGISTLQKHTKYFSLMPQVYRRATEKRYNRLSEVNAEIVRLERIMTKNLYEGSDIKWGITGSDTIGKGTGSYVKYDPAYIYNSGLQTFEILRSPQVENLIYSASKALHNAPKKLKSDDEEMADDAADKAGLFQFCSFPTVDYDFTKACSLDLTTADRDFIIDHILNAKACQKTLLRYLVDNPNLAIPKEFEHLGACALPEDLVELQDLARRFADFIYMVHIRYNYIYSDYQDEEMREEFMQLLQAYQQSGTDIDAVLAAVTICENSGKLFCKEIAHHIAAGDIVENGLLDQTIVNRERRVKGSRRKIGNPAYKYDKKNRIHYYKLTYRWETVRQFMDELRKGTING